MKVSDILRVKGGTLYTTTPEHTLADAAQLMADGAQARARMLADMEAARHEINVLYYIWLADDTGTAVAQALVRAARRGVVCRAMVDGLGSRALLRSDLWQQMAQAGYEKGWGVGRHVLGSNYFRYVRDPWGSYAEYSFDIDFVEAGATWPSADHPGEDSLYVWGPSLPEDFIVNHELQDHAS